MPVINGTPQGDTLNGTEDPDLIRGFNGDDILSGLGGNDELEGGEGADRLAGDAGSDILRGGAGNDELSEFSGENDQLFGDEGADLLRYYKLVSPSVFNALLDGGDGDDRIEYRGAAGSDDSATLLGGTGRDRFFVTGGGEQLTLDAGADPDLIELELFMVGAAITLGAGADVVRLFGNFLPFSGALITINDFAAGDSGDAINLVDYLSGVVPNYGSNPFASGVLQLVQSGNDAVLKINLAAYNLPLQNVVVFKDVAAASLTAHNLGFSPDGAATPGIVLTGSAGFDVLTGNAGDDQVGGGGGNDILYGGAGDDLLEGGEGDDELSGQRGSDELRGGAGADQLIDRHGDDDRLYGEAGNDSLEVDHQYTDGSGSQALLDGGDGTDSLRFYGRLGAGDATLNGGADTDFIAAYGGRSIAIDAGAGSDFIQINLGAQAYAITLGDGVDTLSVIAPFGPGTPNLNPAFSVLDFAAGDAGDKLELQFYLQSVLNGWDPATNPFAFDYLQLAQSGADAVLLIDSSGDGRFFTLLGTLGNVSAAQLTQLNLGFAPVGAIGIAGTSGADNLVGTAAADELFGLAGADFLNGQGGADRLAGGTGNDAYLVDDPLDLVLEGLGEGDDAVLASASYALAAGASVETLSTADQSGSGAASLTGNDVAQSIFGNEGNNQLLGLGGNDQLVGYGGNDVLVGGGGIDYLRGGLGNDVYGIGEGDVILEVAGEGDDSLAADIGSYYLNNGASIETLSTANQAGTFAQNLTGNELGQTVAGSEGANVLNGAGGNDLLRGYGGADIFLFDTAPGANNHDVIADMAVGVDKIALQNAVFTGLAEGNLGAEAFVAGTQAQDANDRIIWNAATNQLLYDADGNGAGAAVLFAIVNGSPNLQATDFIIV